jgi:hypothetical protein
MTVAGDTRIGRNPQKAGVAFTAALWAGRILAAEVTRSVAVSLPGGFLAAHMAETLAFDRRVFYELDADQFAAINDARHNLSDNYTARELRETVILQDNIFNDTEAAAADSAYYDWDITGTIKEAEKYGMGAAINRAAEENGVRCLALTVSLRRAGRDYTIKRWQELITAAVASVPNRVVTFEPEIVYGGIYRKAATMMLLRAVVRDGGEKYDARKHYLTHRAQNRTIKRLYRISCGQNRGRLPTRPVMVCRLLASEFKRDRSEHSIEKVKRMYRSAFPGSRGPFPNRQKMVQRIAMAG